MKDKLAPLAGECNTPDFQVGKINHHEINEAMLIEMRDRFKSGLTVGKRFSTAEIEDRLNGHSCDNYEVIVGPSTGEGDPNSNGDINFLLLKTNPDLYKAYSIALFRGLISVYQPDEFVFFKARRSDRTFDIVFIANKNSNTVYWGDVSDLPTVHADIQKKDG